VRIKGRKRKKKKRKKRVKEEKKIKKEDRDSFLGVPRYESFQVLIRVVCRGRERVHGG